MGNSIYRQLLEAAQKDDVESARRMLQKGINIDDVIEGKTAIMYACEKGSVKVFRLLLSRKVNVNFQDKDGKTALHYASLSKSSECVEAILMKEAIVDMKDRDGKTPFMYAVIQNDLKSLDILLKAKADINFKDKLGKTPLHYAVRPSKPTEALLAKVGGIIHGAIHFDHSGRTYDVNVIDKKRSKY